jgi:hypothetical protein
MKFEQQLSQIAERYRVQGYEVVVHPGPDQLPPFAKDFNIEILAKRGDGNVLVTAKKSQAEVEADGRLPTYAEVIEQHPDWRYDLFVLGPERDTTPLKRDVKEQSEEGIRGSLDDAKGVLRAGFIAQSFIAAWAALESAMRHRLRAQGSDAGWGTSARSMLNELLSSGVFAYSTFYRLEELFELRSVIVHGFSAPRVEPNDVEFLVDTTRQLLDEWRLARQTA